MANLIPWRGRREVDRFRNEMDRLFDDFFAKSTFGRFFEEGDWTPAIDLSETRKEIVVHAEIPDMDSKDIDISLNGRLLTIKGERKHEQEEKDKSYHRIERKFGSFSRSFELPVDVDAEKVKAKYKNGVLKLNLPKKKQQSVKKIEVKTS
jgi:HSP20 family protein